MGYRALYPASLIAHLENTVLSTGKWHRMKDGILDGKELISTIRISQGVPILPLNVAQDTMSQFLATTTTSNSPYARYLDNVYAHAENVR